MSPRASKITVARAGHFIAADGRLCTIVAHAHSTEHGDFPDGWKIEFDDGEAYTVDGAQTVLAYVEHLGLKKL